MTGKAALRILLIVVGSLAFWYWGQALPLLIRIMFFGDCLARANPDLCILAGDMAQLVSFVAVGLVYSLLLWRTLKLFRSSH